MSSTSADRLFPVPKNTEADKNPICPERADRDKAAKRLRARFRDIFSDVYHVRLGVDYAPGSSAAGDNAWLKKLVPSVKKAPQMREWMQRISFMLDHLEAEFEKKLGQPKITEAVRDQVAALASIKYLCANWRRFSVPVVKRARHARHLFPPAPDVVDDCVTDFDRGATE